MVAALYVDRRGPYANMEGVDPWTAERDANTYAGPHAVVAHPPCGPWGDLRHLSLFQDPSCAPRAIELVRKFGGVLEHPSRSKLFHALRIPRPGEFPDEFGGYTVSVDQVEWGHVARKRTLLYVVGVPPYAIEAPPFPGRSPTHWVSGGRKSRTGGGVIPPGIKACSSQQRRRTPPLFAEYLVRLARSVVRPVKKESK